MHDEGGGGIDGGSDRGDELVGVEVDVASTDGTPASLTKNKHRSVVRLQANNVQQRPNRT